jgi:hypothetical protein
MSDDGFLFDEPTAEELNAIGAVLANPNLWAEPSARVEEAVVVAVAAEQAAGPSASGVRTGLPPAVGREPREPPVVTDPGNVDRPATRRRRWRPSCWLV